MPGDPGATLGRAHELGSRERLRMDERVAGPAAARPAPGGRPRWRRRWSGGCERDIFGDDFWRREVRHKDHQRGTVRVTHRPDLGVRLGGLPIPVEVELERKSRARLRGILGMYEELATADEARFGGVIYVTGTTDIADGIRRAAHDVGLGESVLTLRSYAGVLERARAAAPSQRAALVERPGLGAA